MLWSDACISVCSMCFFFVLGDAFLHLIFFNNLRGRRGYVARVLFCAQLALNLSMFQLIIFEIADVTSSTYRLWIWRIILGMVIFLLFAVLPYCQIFFLLRDYSITWTRCTLLSMLGVGLFWYSMWKLGEPLPVISNAAPRLSGSQLLSVSVTMERGLTEGVCRIGFIGVVVIAVLSGFGAINNPVGKYVIKHIARTTESQNDGHEVEWHQQQVLESIINKKKRCAVATFEARKKKLAAPAKTFNIMQRVSPIRMLRGLFVSESDKQISTLHLEIEKLEHNSARAFIEFNDICTAQQEKEFYSTYKGKAHWSLGCFFGAYCVYKFGMAIINITFNRFSAKDPATRFAEILLLHFNVEIDVALRLQQASLVLVACIVMSSIRGFLLTLQKLTDLWFHKISPNSIVIFFAFVMGMNFTAAVLLLRMNLPLKYRRVVTEVLGQDIEYHFYHRSFDIVFAVSMLTSLVILILVEREKAPTPLDGEPDERHRSRS